MVHIAQSAKYGVKHQTTGLSMNASWKLPSNNDISERCMPQNGQSYPVKLWKGQVSMCVLDDCDVFRYNIGLSMTTML
ncbi:MAG: hypothetical protein MJZ15_07730 [Bacteroidales bacterium]|nr:hypothetical protein [Bacteroidales bacterium]